jgi:uncharacterized OsmC-like protein
MHLTVTFQGGTKFHVTSGAHMVVADQPVENGGTDAGMSPVELFVGSLASCVGYFVGRYCARHQIPCDGFVIDAEWSMSEQPHRVGGVTLRINLPARLEDSHKERLLKVAHGCTVHQSLVVPTKVGITIHPP